MAICISCEEEYNDKRKALGYMTCLDCGELDARAIKAARTHAKLCEMTPYVSGSLTQPDALFERRPGSITSAKPKQYVVGE